VGEVAARKPAPPRARDVRRGLPRGSLRLHPARHAHPVGADGRGTGGGDHRARGLDPRANEGSLLRRSRHPHRRRLQHGRSEQRGDTRARATRLRALPGLEGEIGTDLARGKGYDRILCLPAHTMCFSGKAGVLDFYCGDHRALFPGRVMSKQKFACLISDHLPLWAEARTRARGEVSDAWM
jgi:hypothetical protein